MSECRYLVAPDAHEFRTVSGERIASPAPRMLCAWAIYHPASADKMMDAPDWLARNAMAGHLWREGDCDRCPCFDAGDAVETPRAA